MNGAAEGNGDAREILVEMATGFMRGKALCAAVRLGIPEALGEQSSLEGLAAATATEPEALLRLLRALASIGIVEQIDTESFALSELGEPLRRDARGSVWSSMIFWADLLDDSWTYLADCVRAGDRQGAVAAMAREGATSRWSREPHSRQIFTAVFAEGGPEDNLHYARALDLADARLLADLGGAGGGLLAAILTCHPHVRGMLVDRPEEIDAAAARFEDLGLAARVELVSADLTEQVPAGADVYVMRNVLHGYGDEAASAILRRCRAAIGHAGRLVVIEVVLPDVVAQPSPMLESMCMGDLNMLAVTGGKERTASQWRALLDRSGFDPGPIVQIAVAAGGRPGVGHSMIEATPKPHERGNEEPWDS